MLNWDTLIGERNAVESDDNFAPGTASQLSPPSPPKNNEEEKETRADGATFNDEKTYPVSPVAVCLLLACCDKIQSDEQETIDAVMTLKLSAPADQVRGWAVLCQENGIDPVQVQQLAIPSLGEGMECRGCDHLTMEQVRQLSGRHVFRFVCSKQYAVLELGFAGERVLIAPPECNDYAGNKFSRKPR